MEKNIELPNLIIVGAAKSGTTSLHNYLNQHPDIFMSKHKEPHFLINSDIGEKRIHRGVHNLKDYKEMFATKSLYKFKGESSVMYLSFPDFSIKNIKKYLSNNVKIIIMLRNPVERAFAGYLHNVRYNPKESLSFEEAFITSEDRYQENLDMSPDTRYLHVGNYYSQVKAFMSAFQNNVHVIIYDDYVKNINLCLDEVFSFLKLKKYKVNTSKRYMVGGWVFKNQIMRKLLIPNNQIKSVFKFFIINKSFRKWLKEKLMYLSTKKSPVLTKKMRLELINFYKNDVIKLSKLLNRNLNHWLNED